jgi:protein gp37
MSTSIEWVRGEDGDEGETWNPIRGCRRVSEGCRACYAERIAARYSKPGMSFDGIAHFVTITRKDARGRERAIKEARWTGAGLFVPEILRHPLTWRKPRRVFVNSMSDLFFEEFTFQEIAAVHGVMQATKRHTNIVLTKRPERALEFYRWLENSPLGETRAEPDYAAWFWARELLGVELPPFQRTAWPLPNVILGVSTEDQATFDQRVPLLLQCPAACYAVSAEPLLGPIDLEYGVATRERDIDHRRSEDGPWYDVPLDRKLGWVIAGSESGHGARPARLEWFQNMKEQCTYAGVPFFLKQFADERGHKIPTPKLDGRTWIEFPKLENTR